MKLINTIVVGIFLFYGCSNIEFVLQSNKKSAVLKDLISYKISGDKSEYMADALIQNFGTVKEGGRQEFSLEVIMKETKTKTAISTNQVTSAVQYNTSIIYNLVSVSTNCESVTKDYEIKFTHYPKSEGYNLGSDRALNETFKKNISQNVANFKNLLEANQNLTACINED